MLPNGVGGVAPLGGLIWIFWGAIWTFDEKSEKNSGVENWVVLRFNWLIQERSLAVLRYLNFLKAIEIRLWS